MTWSYPRIPATGENSSRILSLTDGTSNPRIDAYFSDGGEPVAYIALGGVTGGITEGLPVLSAGDQAITAITAESGQIGFAVNGTIATDPITADLSGIDQVELGSPLATKLNGAYQSVVLFPRKLTNTQLQQLSALGV
jgi:hypothetical protein